MVIVTPIWSGRLTSDYCLGISRQQRPDRINLPPPRTGVGVERSKFSFPNDLSADGVVGNIV
jgi:hypothetical protein